MSESHNKSAKELQKYYCLLLHSLSAIYTLSKLLSIFMIISMNFCSVGTYKTKISIMITNCHKVVLKAY